MNRTSVGSMMLSAVVAMQLATGHAQTQDPPQDRPDPFLKDMIVIDGRKEPGQLPQWIVWEAALQILATTHGEDSAFTHDLRFGAPDKGQLALAPEEWTLLDAAGQTFSRLEATRGRTAVALQAKYGNPDWTDPTVVSKVDPKVLAQADADSWANDLTYRVGILSARDRLLTAFADDSRMLLLNWVEELKEGISVTTTKADLARLRQPE
jgi:hypothetical protein